MLVIAGAALGQSKKKKKKSKEAPSTEQPTSMNPYYPTEEYEPKKKKKKSKGRISYEARVNFYKRMEDVAKAERKAEKESKKPENANPLYFGHKKPPKKRPPNKMKYCKVCGIRH